MDAPTVISFLFFTALVAFLTWRLTRGRIDDTEEGYFLAGRSLTGLVIAGSLLLTNLSTEQLVGLNGDAYANGLAVMAWEVIAGASLVVLALFFLPRYLKSGIATVPQFLEERYGPTTRALTTFIFIVAYMLILLPFVLFLGAKGLGGMLNLEEMLGLGEVGTIWAIVIFIGVVGSAYAIFGGLRAVAVSDTFNGLGLLVGGLMITFFAFQIASGGGGISEAFAKLKEEKPEHLRSVAIDAPRVTSGTFESHTDSSLTDDDANFTNVLKDGKRYLVEIADSGVEIEFDSWTGSDLIGLTGVEADDAADYTIRAAQGHYLHWSTLFTGVLLLNFFYWTTNQQIIQRTFAAKSLAEGQKGVLLASFFKILAPLILILPGLLAWQVFANKGIDQANMEQGEVYGQLVRTVLPTWLTGFFAAVVMGSILSTFNSVLNSSATLFSLGVYKKIIHPAASQHELVKSGRICSAAVAVLAVIAAPLIFLNVDGLFEKFQSLNGIYFIPLLAIVLFGFFNRTADGATAVITIVVGLVAMVIGTFFGGKEVLDPVTNEVLSKGWMLGTFHSGFHYMGAVFATLLVLQLILGGFMRRPTPYVQHDAKVVDLTPWKHAKAVGISLIVLVFVLYAAFAF